jgi:cytoskeletal protein CcmA (bactofilin family)
VIDGMDNKFFQSEKFNDMQNDEIYGYLESSDDLLIRGEVNGDVFCRGTVYCSGTITGNIRANQVQLYHSHVAGDITCRKIYTDDVSDVQGIIIAESGSVCCRVGGEITITGTPSLLFNQK